MIEKKFHIDAVDSLAEGKYSSCSENGIVVWKDDATDLPTEEEIETEKDRLKVEYDSQEYARNRWDEYPNIGDQLDMLFHDMTAGKGTKDGEWYKAVTKVKADNPKPDGWKE